MIALPRRIELDGVQARKTSAYVLEEFGHAALGHSPVICPFAGEEIVAHLKLLSISLMRVIWAIRAAPAN